MSTHTLLWCSAGLKPLQGEQQSLRYPRQRCTEAGRESASDPLPGHKSEHEKFLEGRGPMVELIPSAASKCVNMLI